MANTFNHNDKVVITDGGSVGVGKTNPTYTLDVAGSLRTTGSITVDSGNQITLDQNYTVHGYLQFSAATFGGESAFGMYGYYGIALNTRQGNGITLRGDSNNVGIGTTSPVTKLEVYGTVTVSGPSAIKWKYSDDYAYFGIGYISGADYGFYNYNYGRTDLYIQQATGNVGIGTTSPTARLSLGAATGGYGITWNDYSNIFSEYSSGDIYFASNFYGNIGASGYKVGATGNFGAGGIAISGTNGGLNGNIRFFADNATSKTLGDAFTPTERMRITGGGNVGIGTTAPGGRLEINHTGDQGSTALILRSSNSNGNGTIRWQSSAGANQAAIGSNYNVGDAGALEFINGATTNMIIRSSGNVGIGTTSPDSKLHINSGANSNSFVKISTTTDAYASGITLRQSSNYGFDIYYDDDGVSPSKRGLYFDRVNVGTAVNSMFIDRTSGNVGIGTTTPNKQLTFSQSTDDAIQIRRLTTSEGNPSIGTGISWTWTSPTTDNETWAAIRVIMPGSGNSNMTFSTTPSSGASGLAERMRITDAGNVGIGTTSPVAKLHVYGSGTTYANIQAGGGDYAYLRLQTPSSGSGYLIKNTATSNDVIDKSLYLWNDNGPIQFVPSQTPANAVTIDTSGSLGIRTASPREKLQVVGNTVIGSAGLNSYKTNLYLTYSATADETWFRIHVPQDYVSSNNGGTIKVRVLWEGDHATFAAYEEYQISYKTLYTSSPYQSFSSVFCTNKTSDFGGGTYYAPSSTPEVNFYTAGDGYLYVLVKGYQAGYNTARYIEAEIFGRTTSPPRIETTTAPSSPSLISKTIQFLPQEGNIYASGNVGIGTTSPATSLQVGGTSGSNFITLSGANTNGEYGINWSFNQPGTNIYSQVKHNWNDRDTKGLQFNTQAGYRFSFNTINGTGVFQSNLVTVLGTGKVGIGTTSPTVPLEITGAGTGGAATLKINTSSTSTFVHSQENIAPNLTSGQHNIIVVGQRTDTRNSGYIGYYWAANASNSNFVTIGHWGVDDIFRVYGNSTVTMSGNVGIGTTSPSYKLDVSGTIRATGDVIAYSDARVKENVETIPNALETVKSMRGVGYNKIGEEKRSIGVIAQELLEVLPEAVHQDESGMYSVAYGNIVGVLVEAIKEQQNQIDELKAKLDGLTK